MTTALTLEQNANVFLADFRFALFERGELFLTGTYTQTDAGMDPWVANFADDVPTELFPDGLPGPGPDPNAPIAFGDYDFSEVNTYSDLDYTELRATLGFNYNLSQHVRLFGGISYYDLEDNAPFYENQSGIPMWDQSGDVTRISGGAVWKF